MQVDITFKKSNADELVEKYEIYRSDNKDDLYAQENLLATITEFSDREVINHVDATAEYATPYYYGLLTIAVDGSAIPSVARYVNIPKNRGSITGVPMVGDLQAGIVQVHSKRVYGVSENLKAATLKALTGQAGFSQQGALSVGIPGMVEAYYEGMPSIYLPFGYSFLLLTVSSTLNTSAFVRKSWADTHANLGGSILFEENEYNPRPIKKSEWLRLFSGIFMPYNTQLDGGLQPLCKPLTTSSNVYTSGEYIALLDDTTQQIQLYQISQNPAGIVLTMLPESSKISAYIYVPVALSPIQY